LKRSLLVLDEVRGDREAALRNADGRAQVCGKTAGAVVANGLVPGRDHTWHSHRQPRMPGVFEGERLTGGRVEEQLRRARSSAHLTSVDRHYMVGLGKVDGHEATASRTCHERLGDPECAGHGNRGIDGGAT